jgi:hypothetical protein
MKTPVLGPCSVSWVAPIAGQIFYAANAERFCRSTKFAIAAALHEPLDFRKIDPNFDPLRTNPRFQKLVAGR